MGELRREGEHYVVYDLSIRLTASYVENWFYALTLYLLLCDSNHLNHVSFRPPAVFWKWCKKGASFLPRIEG